MRDTKFSFLLISIIVPTIISMNYRHNNFVNAQPTNNNCANSHCISNYEGEGTVQVKKTIDDDFEELNIENAINYPLPDNSIIFTSEDAIVTVTCKNGKKWIVPPGLMSGVLNGCSGITTNPYEIR